MKNSFFSTQDCQETLTFILLLTAAAIILNIIYSISDFLHFPARNKIYEGAARVHFITWLNVVGVIPFITVAKDKMY